MKDGMNNLSSQNNDGSLDVPVNATEAGHGRVCVERRSYRPLEKVRVRLTAPASGASRYRVAWLDNRGREYGCCEGDLFEGKAEVVFRTGGAPGMQLIHIWFDPSDPPGQHDRVVHFYLELETQITCDDPDLSALYEQTHEAVRLNRRRFTLQEGPVVGYATADSGFGPDFWLRDMFYSAGAYVLWESEITSGYEAIWRRQAEDGHFPDFVKEDGSSQRMSSESDVEYIAVLALERIWRITGDTKWLKTHLPTVEKGLSYLTSDPTRWHKDLGMVLRGHTCDTWDFDIETEGYVPTRRVAAICDQSGLYAAWQALGRMYHDLNDTAQSERYFHLAETFRNRCNELLWDGEKYLHHHHVDAIEHTTFDERDQLAMGNTWAMTRGLADRAQCLSLLQTYMRRWNRVGDPQPWWSLQPGYPVEEGTVLRRYDNYLRPGGYCNGGLMPWVGAALALAAFENGREDIGADLLKKYASFLREQNGSLYTWYWPNLEPGFRSTTPNTTAHDGWGLGHWMDTLVQGLVGFQIVTSGFQTVEISPRWPAVGVCQAHVVLYYPSAEQYVAYEYHEDAEGIHMHVTGTCQHINLRFLLPPKRRVKNVRCDNTSLPVQINSVEKSAYLVLPLTVDQKVWNITVEWS